MNNPIITDIIEDYNLEKVSESSITDSFKKWISKVILWFKKIWYKIKSFFIGKKNDVVNHNNNGKEYVLVKGVDSITNICKLLDNKISIYESLISKLKNNEDIDINENELEINISKLNEYKKEIKFFKGGATRINVERLKYADNDKVYNIIEDIKKNVSKLFSNIIDELTYIKNKTNDNYSEKCRKVISIIQKSIPNLTAISKTLNDLNNNLLKKEYLNESPVTISPDFKEAIKNKKISLVRIMIKNYLMIAVLKPDIDIYVNYAEKELGTDLLYEKNVKVEIRNENMDWDKYDQNMVYLVNNFNKKNLEAMIQNTYNLYIVNWYKDV